MYKRQDWKFDTVMEILKTFQNDGNLAKISEVGITENNTYRIITKNNVVMTVSDLDKMCIRDRRCSTGMMCI